MRQAFLIKAGDLCDLIEKEIANGNKLETPEQWDEFIFRIHSEGKADHLAAVPNCYDDAELLAAELRETGIKAKVLKNDTP